MMCGATWGQDIFNAALAAPLAAAAATVARFELNSFATAGVTLIGVAAGIAGSKIDSGGAELIASAVTTVGIGTIARAAEPFTNALAIITAAVTTGIGSCILNKYQVTEKNRINIAIGICAAGLTGMMLKDPSGGIIPAIAALFAGITTLAHQ
jgi:hypothetical protein